MERKRSHLEVIRDILQVVRNKNGRAKPTHILYKSNLSHNMMKDYLDELITKKFIVEEKDESGKGRIYKITEKGNKYLFEYNRIVGFMDSFGLS
ncbi:MAG: winged helix-turn-helix domain-containing protein [Nanoarchaeota archaeon]